MQVLVYWLLKTVKKIIEDIICFNAKIHIRGIVTFLDLIIVRLCVISFAVQDI